jgi:hypothetical protein
MKKVLQNNLLLILILLGAFVVRLYRLDNPIADWHSWRQADTSAVSRDFVHHGYDLLHPTFEDLSNVPSGIDNPKGYRFVEFPIYNVAQAGLFQIFHGLTLEEWGRIVSIIANLFSILFIYLLVSKYANKTVGLFSGFFYAFFPYNIYYGRTILPDPSTVMATFGTLYFFDKWVEVWPEKKKAITSQWYLYGIVSILFCVSAFLLKPYAGFFLLPMLYSLYNKFGFSFWRKWQLYIFAIVSITPFIAWRLWISQYPEGIPASAWLLNGNGIRFRPAFFRWMVYERVTKLISGYAGVVLLLLGVFITKKQKHWFFFAAIALSSIIYVSVIATGNVQHDYYQIYVIPSIAIFYGIGAAYLFDRVKPQIGGRLVLVVITIISFYFSWNIVKDYFNINNWAMVKAGRAVDTLTPKDAKIIAPYDGDTSFLYLTNRKGWPSFEHSTEELMKLGAGYLVIVNPKPQDYDLDKKFKLVSKTNEYILVNLHEKP